jgi:acyl-CoA synthetase (AMP-forming)/AMP-acid ligase II
VRKTAEELPRRLKGDLPNFMQPSVIHWKDAMPISPNGKLDRAGLYQEMLDWKIAVELESSREHDA